MKELGEGTGGRKITVHFSAARIGVATFAADGTAFVLHVERPLGAVANARVDILPGPVPGACGVNGTPEFLPLLFVGIAERFTGPRIGARGATIAKVAVLEVDFVAFGDEPTDVKVQPGREVVRAFGAVVGHGDGGGLRFRK